MLRQHRPKSLRFFGEEVGSDETQAMGSEGQVTDGLGGNLPPQPSTGTPGENPAWKEYLDQFPDSVRHIARDAFTKWDSGVQQRFDSINKQYQPYKSFIDQKLDPNELNSAYQVASMLRDDPVGFTQLLAERLGLTLTEAQALTEQVSNETQDEPEEDPRIQQLMESQQQLLSTFQQQEQARQQEQMVQQQTQQMEVEFAQIEQAYGRPLPVELKNEVMREALRLSHETNKPVSMQDAYSSLEKLVSAVRNVPRPGATAPRTMPSGGSMPVSKPQQSLGSLTSKDTKGLVTQLLIQANAQD